MIGRFRRLLASKTVADLAPGDFARQLGSRAVGLVEAVSDGHATIAWDRDRRDILPLAVLRRVPASGHKLDSRSAP